MITIITLVPLIPYLVISVSAKKRLLNASLFMAVCGLNLLFWMLNWALCTCLGNKMQETEESIVGQIEKINDSQDTEAI